MSLYSFMLFGSFKAKARGSWYGLCLSLRPLRLGLSS